MHVQYKQTNMINQDAHINHTTFK